MSTVATEPAHRTPKSVRVALLAVIALGALATVAQGTIALIDLAARHTTIERQRFGGVRSIVIGDASDVRLTTAPAGAPLEVRTKLTEGLRKPSHDARVTGGGSLVLTSSCGWVVGNSCGVDYEVRVPAGTRADVRAARATCAPRNCARRGPCASRPPPATSTWPACARRRCGSTPARATSTRATCARPTSGPAAPPGTSTCRSAVRLTA